MIRHLETTGALLMLLLAVLYLFEICLKETMVVTD